MLAKKIERAEVAKDIGEFVRETCGFTHGTDPSAAPLSALGVDSFSLLEIILFIERRYGVKLPLELLTPENTRTINELARTTADFAASSGR